MIRRDLQKVPVARYKGDFHPFGFSPSCECAENIVRFQPRLLPDLHAHGLEDFFDQGDLFAKFLRHRFPCPFIFLVGLVAERRRMDVKGHR